MPHLAVDSPKQTSVTCWKDRQHVEELTVWRTCVRCKLISSSFRTQLLPLISKQESRCNKSVNIITITWTTQQHQLPWRFALRKVPYISYNAQCPTNQHCHKLLEVIIKLQGTELSKITILLIQFPRWFTITWRISCYCFLKVFIH